MTESIEQQIQLYGTLSTIFMIAAIAFLVLAIALFVLFKVPQTFNEYRGKSAQKAIAEMAANSAESGMLSSSSLRKSKSGNILNRKRSYTDSLSDDLTGDMSRSQPEPPVSMETSRMDINQNDSSAAYVMSDPGANATTVMSDPGENATTVMNDPGENATTVMGASATEEGTMVLNTPQASAEEGTMVLNAQAPAGEGTMVLNASQLPSGDGTMVLNQSQLQRPNPQFVIERSIMVVHTDEVI